MVSTMFLGNYKQASAYTCVAEAMAAGKHKGYAETAWDGINQSAEVLAEKGIKVVLNGGALNPKGLALRIADMVSICFVSIRRIS